MGITITTTYYQHPGAAFAANWQIDPWLPGVIQHMVATVQKYKISRQTCSRFRLQGGAFAPILVDGSGITGNEPSGASAQECVTTRFPRLGVV